MLARSQDLSLDYNTPDAIGATAITQSFNMTLRQTLDNLAPYLIYF
ncbi:hypothetical protein [Anabaena sp. CS-542/02]|nr:hypothetical protein [Anabaena sp. CS-542/02]MDB9445583.1 hypothetical protein [Anabaena sp. CS-542/02]